MNLSTKVFHKILVAIFISLPLAAGAADIGGIVYGNFGNPYGNISYNELTRQRFVYYMTTEEVSGEKWGTILILGYPGTAEVAGLYTRFLDGSSSPKGVSGEWGFVLESNNSGWYDTGNRKCEINGSTASECSDLVKWEFFNVKYNCYPDEIKAVRVKFKYRNTISKMRIEYRSTYIENGNRGFASTQMQFNGGSGQFERPVVSLDGSLADIINAPVTPGEALLLPDITGISASSTSFLPGGSFCQADPEELVNKPIDTTPLSKTCGTLLAATNFSPKESGKTHLTTDEIEWYDATNSLEFSVYYPEAFEDYPEGEYDKGYAIVSNPKTWDGSLDTKTDGDNRLLIKLPRIYSEKTSTHDPVFRFKLGGMKPQTEITVQCEWEVVSTECLVKDNSSSPDHSQWLRYASEIEGYTGYSNINFDNVRPLQHKTINQTVSLASDGITFMWKPLLRISNGCTVLALKNIKLYACPKKSVQRSITYNLACEKDVVNLLAIGYDPSITSFDWYMSNPSSGDINYYKIPGVTGKDYDYVTELGVRNFKVAPAGTTDFSDTTTVQGRVCCSLEEGSYITIWKEDFGTVPRYSRKESSYVQNHTFSPYNNQIADGYYGVVSNSTDGNCGVPEEGHTDHTGNVDGGFVIINVGMEPTEKEKLVFQYDAAPYPYCAGIWYNASFWVSQIASIGTHPATIVIRIYELVGDEGSEVENLLAEGVTGQLDIFRMEEWLNYSMSFSPGAGTRKIRVKIFNRGQSGMGNDITFDDLLFSSCSPQVGLTIHGGLKEYEYECGSNIDFELEVPSDVSRFFSNTPWAGWQYSTDGGATWTTFSKIEGVSIPARLANNKSGELYRVVMAGDEATLDKILAGEDVDCTVYAVTNEVTVSCNGDCPTWEGPIIYHE